MGERLVVFVSYVRGDQEWCDKLTLMLQPLVRNRHMELWVDRASIPPGSEWRHELEAGIERSTLAVLLVSGEYLASTFVMEEELPALEARGIPLLPMLIRECPWETEPRVERLQWLHDPRRPGPLARDGRSPHDAGALAEITEICGRIASVLSSQSPYVEPIKLTPVSVVPLSADENLGQLNGVPPSPRRLATRAELGRLREALLSGERDALGITGDAKALGLHGQGGIGKTVLAVELARDPEVRRHFADGVFWLTVGEAGDRIQAQIELLTRLGKPLRDIQTASEGVERLRDALRERRCLIVIDDVWSGATAAALLATGPLGRTVFTTRDVNVLEAVRAYVEQIDVLDRATARSLLAQASGLQESRLPAVANQILEATGRVALAVVLVGAAMREGRLWEEVAADLERGSATFRNHPYANAFKAMQVALDALDAELRRVYRSLVVFPEETRVPGATVARYWRDNDASERLKELERRGLIVLTDDTMSLHPLQRTFLLLEASDNAVLLHGELLDTHRPVGGWAALPREDDYFWRHLVDHLLAARENVELAAVLTNVAYLAIRTAAFGVHSAETDLGRAAKVLPENETITWLQRLWARWGYLLTGDEGQVASTLNSRLVDAPPHVDASVLSPLLPESYLCPSDRLPDPPPAVIRVLEHPGGEPAIAFSPDGRWLAAAAGRDVRLWDIDIVAEPIVLESSYGTVVAFSPGGTRLAVGLMVSAVDVWDLELRIRRTLRAGTNWMYALAFSSDGRFVAAGGNGGASVWDLKRDVHVGTLPLHWGRVPRAEVDHIAFAPNAELLAVVDERGGICLWEFARRSRAVWIRRPRKRGSPMQRLNRQVLDIAFADGGRMLRVARHTDVLTFEVATGNLVGQFKLTSFAQSAAFSGDAEVVAINEADLVLRDAATGRVLVEVPGRAGANATALSRDRRVVAGVEGNSIRLWTLEKIADAPREVGTFWAPTLIASDGRDLVRISDSGVDLLHLPDDTSRTLPRPDGMPRNANAYVNSLLAAGGKAGVQVWSLIEGRCVLEIRHTRTNPWDPVAFTPDGRLLAISGRAVIKIVAVDTGQTVYELPTSVKEPRHLAFSPDATGLVLLGYDGFEVWRSSQLMFHGSGPDVWSRPAFSPDGLLLAAGTRHGVRVWETLTGADILLPLTDDVEAVAFAPSGEDIATLSPPGRAIDRTDADRVAVWHLEDRSLVADLRLGVEIDDLSWGSWGITATRHYDPIRLDLHGITDNPAPIRLR